MVSILHIGRTYRHMRRYREVATVLLRYEFGDLVRRLGLLRYLPIGAGAADAPATTEHRSRYERIRLAFEDLGPTFVKLGQFMSTRPDILPMTLVREFAKLQDTVKPFSAAEAREIVEAELGRPVEELFAVFEEEPVASASMAQVCRAVTPDGQEVAVKVQRPGIRGTVETDLEIMADLAGLIERLVEGADLFEPVRMVDEFSRAIRREMDFTCEAGNMERFARLFEGDRRIHVPGVFRDLTTERVLTMEFMHGVKVSRIGEYEDDIDNRVDRQSVARRGVQLVFEQIFTHGFFHADPHPGNIMVLEGNRICFLDYGLTGVLSLRHREYLARIMEGFATQNEHQAVSAAFELTGYRRYDKALEIESRVANLIQDHFQRPLGEVRIGMVISEFTGILRQYGIRLPADFFLLVKAVTTIEGVGSRILPSLNVLEEAVPFLKRAAGSRRLFRNLKQRLPLFLLELQSVLRDMPTEARELITLVKHGDLRIKFEHLGLPDLMRLLDQVTNRLVVAIVLAALVVGSSVMTLSGIPPKWYGIPVLGVAGFLITGVISLWLLWSIIRHGRM